jgi:hypothetical protein
MPFIQQNYLMDKPKLFLVDELVKNKLYRM